MGYQEFKLHGLNIVAAFDKDPSKAGTSVHNKPVYSIDQMEEEIRKRGISMAVLTVPWTAAQEVTDILVRAGVSAIWNFTNVKLKVPPEVVVQKEDLSSGYAMLCIMLQTKNLELGNG
jgi:redox-sensing transcriptional repressor